MRVEAAMALMALCQKLLCNSAGLPAMMLVWSFGVVCDINIFSGVDFRDGLLLSPIRRKCATTSGWRMSALPICFLYTGRLRVQALLVCFGALSMLLSLTSSPSVGESVLLKERRRLFVRQDNQLE